MDKYLSDIRRFQAFFTDSRNESIVKTLKKICYAETVMIDSVKVAPTGELFAYQMGRRDVWNEVLKILKIDTEQEKKTLEQIEREQNG